MDAREALALWLGEGLIGPELAEQLADRLDVDDEPGRTSGVIRLLVFVGSLLIGGGLLLFIGSQWDNQSPTRRLLLLAGVYSLVVIGAAIAESRHLTTTARGLWFLSSLAVGANIFLIGQIFNLPLNYWQGTLLWLIATMVMGWASPSEAQGWLAVVLGVLTLGWISVPSAQFFDQGAFLFDAGGIRPLLSLLGLTLVAGPLVLPADFDFVRRPAQAIGALLLAVPLTLSTFHPTLFAAIFEIDLRLFHGVLFVVLLVVLGTSWLRSPNRLIAYGLGALTALLVIVLPQVDPSSGASGNLGEFNSVSWLAKPFDRSELLFGLYNAVGLRFGSRCGCGRSAVPGQGPGQCRLRGDGRAVGLHIHRADRRHLADGAGRSARRARARGRSGLPRAKTARSGGTRSGGRRARVTRRHRIAVLVGFATMIVALVPPLWVRATGDQLTLEIRPVDPLSLFRGNYVDLRYDVPVPPGSDTRAGSVYVVFDDQRPAQLVRLSRDRPSLETGELCIRGEFQGGDLAFPSLEQFFVTPERGRELESDLLNTLAVLKATQGCRAVLVDLEPE